MARSLTNNLLTSGRGVELPADICLRVVDLVIHDAPKNIVLLLKLSRSFKKLIKAYERALTKNAAKLYANSQVNQQTHLIALSQPKSNRSCLAPNFHLNHTFAWLLEVQTRSRTTQEIIQDPISQCHTPTIYWANGTSFDPPSLPIPAPELEIRIVKFKQEALKLLYELLDATQGIQNEWRARTRQINHLVQLSTPELAILCIFIPILGFNLLEKLKNHSQSLDTKREIIIFQHNLIRYGPIVAWLHISSGIKCERMGLGKMMVLNGWFKEKQVEGVRLLRRFERGATREANMSLLLWRVFQERGDVSRVWGWEVGRVVGVARGWWRRGC
ncbi:88ec3c1e-49d4-40f7-b0d3-d0d7dca235c9 [Sclerotinia trifoliorum]|uniref:88ec3c1e-49d4-40f7-b0d3-d0d7dca235c9 n=1 Tax=Sclerotinia trifoliorum TaxID=28548 RepID=A0A8H2ZSR5_9HELO|nr:88ec3c1e-49d4-40f7-b0d3-d0d7dca235c9 [Sclerotinia trifoliorum]